MIKLINPIQEMAILNLVTLQSGYRMARKAANDISQDIYGVPYKQLTAEIASEFIQFLAGKRSLAGQRRR